MKVLGKTLSAQTQKKQRFNIELSTNVGSLQHIGIVIVIVIPVCYKLSGKDRRIQAKIGCGRKPTLVNKLLRVCCLSIRGLTVGSKYTLQVACSTQCNSTVSELSEILVSVCYKLSIGYEPVYLFAQSTQSMITNRGIHVAQSVAIPM